MPDIALDEIQSTFKNNKAGTATLDSMPAEDASKLGETNPIQYAPKPISLAERVGEDITKPFIETQHEIGSGLQWLGNNLKDNTPFGGLGDRITRAGIVLRERASANLAKNYSNFKPNILDNLIGSVPTLAAYLGVSAMAGPELALGGVVAATGAAVSAENFAKFKEKGYTTPASDALALAIGVPTAGVMAAGFGLASKLTAPWLTKVLGESIGKIASNAVVGGAGFGAQTATQGTLELATGAESYKDKESLINLMAETANSAVIGGVLGGATALPYVLARHNALMKGFEELGLKPEDAKAKTDTLLGQASHVVMDKVEQHLDMTKDEQGRINITPINTGKQIEPNMLERKGIPMDYFYPSVKELPADEVAKLSEGNKYVKLEPIDLEAKSTEKATAQDIRERYVGGLDRQVARGNYLRQDLQKLAPDEQSAIFWYEGANGDKSLLKAAIEKPEEVAESLLRRNHEASGEKELFKLDKDELASTVKALKEIKLDLQGALNLSDEAKKAVEEGRTYYKEAGEVSSSLGTIREVLENYQSMRLYKPEPPADYLKVQGRTGLKQFSSHSLERFYDNPFLALAGGKEFATTNYADLIALHNQEMSVVNHARQLADAMSDVSPLPLGKWTRPGVMPKDWQQIGNISKEVPIKDRNGEAVIGEDGNQLRMKWVFAAPKGIADGLKALVDPDYLRQLPGMKTIQEVQGIAKTGLLSYSFFHHLTFTTQTLASLNGWKTLADLPNVLKSDIMSTPEFRGMEQRFLGATGTTTITHEVQDILRGIDTGDDAIAKVLKAPVAKQLGDVSKASTSFLFDGMQRWLKVSTFGKNMAAWEAKNPGASVDEIHNAEIGFAKGVNAEFGGLNWEAMGIDRTRQSIARLFLLAPDWVGSMLSATKYAVSDFGTAGQLARGTLFKAVVGGMVMGDALNYLRTGHHMWDNKAGHKFDIEIAPDVYMSPIRGAPGELLKLVADVVESGGLKGAARYGEGKLSPFMSAGMTAISGVNYYGGDIWKGESALQQNVNGVWNIVSHMLPMPIGIMGAINYATREQEQSPVGWGMVATGLGRFSKGKRSAESSEYIKPFRSGGI